MCIAKANTNKGRKVLQTVRVCQCQVSVRVIQSFLFYFEGLLVSIPHVLSGVVPQVCLIAPSP